MPTIISHPAVPLAAAHAFGSGVISRRLLCAGVFVSILPDLDVLSFRFAVPYAAAFGHRGFSHSVLFAFCVALAGACLFRLLRSTFSRSFLFLFAATASHGILDAFTNGGMGVAFWWPWSETRYLFPIQVIEVSPLGIPRFFSLRGVFVLWSEFLWIWLPLFSCAWLVKAFRHRTGRRMVKPGGWGS
jgi:inner membrane protein